MTSRTPAPGAAWNVRAVFFVLAAVGIVHPHRAAAQESSALFDAPLVVLDPYHAFRHTGNIDGDAYPDAVGTWSQNTQVTVIVWCNDGQGRFLEKWSTSFSKRWPGVVTFAAGDLDGDGLLDWAIGIPSHRGTMSTVSLYLNRGDGVCSLWREYDEDPHVALLIDDLDGDGLGEIVSCSRSTQSDTLRIRRTGRALPDPRSRGPRRRECSPRGR